MEDIEDRIAAAERAMWTARGVATLAAIVPLGKKGAEYAAALAYCARAKADFVVAKADLAALKVERAALGATGHERIRLRANAMRGDL